MLDKKEPRENIRAVAIPLIKLKELFENYELINAKLKNTLFWL